MTTSFSLADPLSLSDLRVFLGRAARIEDGAVRMIASNSALAVYAPVLYPRGILDRGNTVLGLRIFALSADVVFDRVIGIRALSDRLARLQSEPGGAAGKAVQLPDGQDVTSGTWAGIAPPRGGWLRVEQLDPSVLEAAARAGIDEVAAAIPAGTGEQIVNRVRTEIWGRPIEHAVTVPAGAAFAAFSLGFLGKDDPVAVFEASQWIRLTSRRGHVLVRRGF